MAAYAPDINDTILSLATKFGPPAFAQHLVIDERGFSTIDTEGYVKVRVRLDHTILVVQCFLVPMSDGIRQG